MKLISFSARVRVHVPDDITDKQLAALTYNITSQCCPTLLVQDQTETHLMDVASPDDVNVLNTIDIDEIDVWIDEDYHIRQY